MPDKTYAPDLRNTGVRHQGAPTSASTASAPDTTGMKVTDAPNRALLSHDVLALQRAAGNRAVTSLLNSNISRSVPRLTAVQRKLVAAQPALVQRAPETWYRGEAEGVPPARPGSVIHDFGDGLYLTDDSSLAAQYAALRASPHPETGRVLAASFERSLLGRMLDLNTDPRWAAYMSETTPGGLTHEQLIRMANENYWSFFQEFLRRNGLSLDSFDSIIGPEYVRSGTQMCIRNPSTAGQIRAMLAPPSAGPASGDSWQPCFGNSYRASRQHAVHCAQHARNSWQPRHFRCRSGLGRWARRTERSRSNWRSALAPRPLHLAHHNRR